MAELARTQRDGWIRICRIISVGRAGLLGAGVERVSMRAMLESWVVHVC